MPARLPRTFGERLLALRQVKGLTLLDLAAHSGVSKASISRYETVPDSNYTRTSVDLLAKCLEVDPAYLLGLSVDLQKLDPRQVAARQALARFLDAGSFTQKQRGRFHRIQDHAAAPVTVQGWQDFWSMVRGFFGRGPSHLTQSSPSPSDTTLLIPRREMLRAQWPTSSTDADQNREANRG